MTESATASDFFVVLQALLRLQTYESATAEVAKAEYAVHMASRMMQELQGRIAADTADLATPSPDTIALTDTSLHTQGHSGQTLTSYRCASCGLCACLNASYDV